MAERDECVAYAIECLWEGVEQHMKDKFIFPQIVSHAVARTLAGMVRLVSVSVVQKLDNWDSHFEGRVAEEWVHPKEMLLPPLDAWARGVVPIKQNSPPISPRAPADGFATAATSSSTSPVVSRDSPRGRRSTVTSLPSGPLQTASQVYDRKGSPRRRFSDGIVLPPEMIQKLKKPPAEAERRKSGTASEPRKSQTEARKSQVAAPEEAPASTASARRSIKAAPSPERKKKATPTAKRKK